MPKQGLDRNGFASRMARKPLPGVEWLAIGLNKANIVAVISGLPPRLNPAPAMRGSSRDFGAG
jgi:hypothetical protein